MSTERSTAVGEQAVSDLCETISKRAEMSFPDWHCVPQKA